MQFAPNGATVLTSRNGIDFTHEFADLTDVLTPALDGRAAVLDGEIVVYTTPGRSTSVSCRDAVAVTRPTAAPRAARRPSTMFRSGSSPSTCSSSAAGHCCACPTRNAVACSPG